MNNLLKRQFIMQSASVTISDKIQLVVPIFLVTQNKRCKLLGLMNASKDHEIQLIAPIFKI